MSLCGHHTAFAPASDVELRIRFGRTHALRTVDCSSTGVGAISDTVVTPGTYVSVGFDTPENPARRGVVARCLPCGNGYRVAVVFEGRLAA